MNAAGDKVAVEADINVGDIAIGAIEIKDGATDNRATVDAANTARTTATKVIPVQHVDEAGNVGGVRLRDSLNKTNDAVTAHIAPGDSKIGITASAQLLSGPGKLKGFWIVSHTAGATVRFADAPTATTPYVSSAWTSAAGHLAGDYIMMSQNGMQMATACYCIITGTIEILPDVKLD